MTENEAKAINWIENIRDDTVIVKEELLDNEPIRNTLSHAIRQKRDRNAEVIIKAISELDKYRAIGTVEECREARERQRRKKPKIWTTPDDGVNLIYYMYKCPNCGEEHKIDYYNEYSYCPNCGQAVKLFE